MAFRAAAGGSSGSSGVTIGTTPITSGTSGRVFYDAAGVVGESTALTTDGTTATIAGKLTFSGNISAAAWTTSGIKIQWTVGTVTDTSSSGTVASASTGVIGGDTVAASSATTYTNYYGVYFKTPVAGSNVTMTAKWDIGCDNGIKVVGAGTAAAPAFQCGTGQNGVFASSTNRLGLVAGGTQLIDIDSAGMRIRSAQQYLFSGTTTDPTSAADVGFKRVAAKIVSVTDGSSGSGCLQLPSFTVATLPAASTAAYTLATVSDANATTARSTVAGGGANKVLVMSDGTNWIIMG